jgi:hypothetical protein
VGFASTQKPHRSNTAFASGVVKIFRRLQFCVLGHCYRIDDRWVGVFGEYANNLHSWIDFCISFINDPKRCPPRETRTRAARTFSDIVSFNSTLDQAPSYSSAALAYSPAGTARTSAVDR